MSEDEDPKTIFIESDDEFFEELSDYLDALSNPTRLKILKSIEKKPKDVREISYDIGISYENTKKHIQKLHLAGVIKKETGLSGRKSKGVHPVWKYSIMPGGLDSIFKNLQIFGDINLIPNSQVFENKIKDLKAKLSEELTTENPVIFIVGGPEDGTAYPINAGKIRIGRSNSDQTYLQEKGDIVFSEFYGAVSRITKPHCYIHKEASSWYIEDVASTGGTYLNDKLLEKEIRYELSDGDVIELSRGARSGRFIFSNPKSE
ncbi:FHA domain-containing protein [Methanoplanus sp. FWC-SCC4]|uniref:FHA domain-containing protein n=1 Tax=Methanochimaera problematica TaxID=2609417 RepID=A0AA97FCA2_9EURY|nr:FHA domain-containing protein [Methanoplanus sp. FWC-SCC4]WOF16227.1 FHA domain-containing protein [Methanoplanus sp. FWC-SCC4]